MDLIKYQQLMKLEEEKKRREQQMLADLMRKQTSKRSQPIDTDRKATTSYYAAHKFLPISIRQVYKQPKFSHLPRPPQDAKD